jgi:hypothetical protein
MASTLFESVKASFEVEEWAYREVAGEEVILAGFDAQHLKIELHVQVFEKIGGVSVVSESAKTTYSPALRERLAELILRTNQELTVGNFEMFWDEGRVVFRACNLFPGGKGDPGIISGMVLATISEMDRLAPMMDTLFEAEKCAGGELAALSIPVLMETTGSSTPQPTQEENE